MERAFGTLLHDYAIGRGTYRGRRGPLLLPAEIIPRIGAGCLLGHAADDEL
jgi:hypothetical protein